MPPSDSHCSGETARAPVAGERPTEAPNPAHSVLNLALQIADALRPRPGAVVASFLTELGKELPAIRPVLIALESICEKAGNSKRNREVLAVLRDRCMYVTACVIIKCRCSASTVDISPLVERMNEVEGVVRRYRSRGRVGRAMRGDVDRRDLTEMYGRISGLSTLLGLAGIMAAEERVDDVKELLATMNTKLEMQSTRAPSKAIIRRSQVPRNTPAHQSWQVTRESVVTRVVRVICESLRRREVGGSKVVGLVGESGSGKTTAAAGLVRNVAFRELFPDGIVWLNIGEGGKVRLRDLMQQLADALHETIDIGGGGEGRGTRPPSPADSDKSGVAYIKETLREGHDGQSLQCLVVADDVWDAAVITELRKTGLWVLATTRQEDLLKSEDGEVVRIDTLSDEEADSVLRAAAEIPPRVFLPDAQQDLMELCGNVALDVAFVGRWDSVRGRQDRLAWSDAAASIRIELDADDYDASDQRCKESRAKLRAAVLRTGFDELGAEGRRVQWLYLALTVMPDAYAFSVGEAAALLYDRECDMADIEAGKKLVDTLVRWSIVRAEGSASGVSETTRGWWRTQKYRMHAAHSTFARESLMDRVDVLGPAVKRWAKHISSPEAIKEISPVVLVGLWRAVERVGGDGWRVNRPFEAASAQIERQAQLQGVHSVCSVSVQSALRGAQFHIDRKEWTEAFDTWSRAVNLVSISAITPSKPPLAAASSVSESTCRSSAELVFEKLVELGWCAWEADQNEVAVELARKGARMGEEKLGPDDILVAKALWLLAGFCGRTGREKEEESLLRRALKIRETKLGPNTRTVSMTLHQLACCVWNTGRCEEGISLLRRALDIVESKTGGVPDNPHVAHMRQQLERWVRETEETE